MKLLNTYRGRTIRLLAMGLALLLLLPCFAACAPANGGEDAPKKEHVDYVAQTKLDETSTSRKITAEVKSYIDGDTTHFYVETSAEFPDGVVKARYLAIDTPESTGRLEEWGKAASAFTKETLKNAAAILLESDDENWNKDNNGRHLLWIWYKAEEAGEWRNLNIEILQNGYAVASNSGQNRYGSTCLAALAQATYEKLYVHSGEKDPSFPYGDATEITLKELRTNREAYEGVKVAVEGVISQDTNGTLYIEAYDAEDECYYGMQVFYGYNMATSAKRFLKAGNRVRIVGTFQYAEVVNAWQIAGLDYDQMDPKNPKYTQLLDTDQPIAYEEIVDLVDFTTGKTDYVVGEETVSFDNNYLALHTSVSLKGLKVVETWTTTKETSDDKGAITLVCEKDGVRINIRTIVLYENNEVVTAERYEGQTIDVVGVVDSYTPEGSTEAQVQIRVFSVGAITIH